MEQQQPHQDGINGRSITRRTEEEILKHLSDQEQSGFTVKEYCALSEINEATFYGWLKKYRPKTEEEVKGQSSTGQTGFASIEVIPTLVYSKPQLFAEIGNIKLYKEVSAEYLKTLLS